MSRAVMKSLVVKRSVIIDGHKTSMSLEDDFWQGVKKIAAGRRVTIAGLVHEIDRQRQQGNLSSAVRLFVLEYYRSRVHAQRETSEPGLSA
jgi:predicted DNA-binding ribbon-helix-helix protein